MFIPEPIRILKRRILRKQDGDRLIKDRFKHLYGRPLPPEPKTYTEKLYARMVDLNSNDKPLFTKLADKFEAREWVEDRIGAERVTPLLWSGVDAAKAPFEQFIGCFAKTSHGSGGHKRLTSPLDRAALIEHFRKMLGVNYYWAFREAQYHGIKPRLMIEPTLNDGFEHGPLDYRHWCFDGKVEMIQIDNAEHGITTFYDRNWKKLDIKFRPQGKPIDIPKPPKLSEMIEAAERLATGIDFVRVDLYNLFGDIRFGEMTFTPTAGTFHFKPPEIEARLGALWR